MKNNLTIIYHNPNCSKSKRTLEFLKENKENPQIIEYLKTPPSKEDLKKITTMLHLKPTELIRKGEQIYKDLESKQGAPNENTAIQWMIKYPKLIERPIVIKNNKAKIGRPPESVIEIL